MPVNDEIYDRLIVARTGLLQFEHKTVRRMSSIFQAVESELKSYLLGLNEGDLPKYGARNKFQIYQKLVEYMGNGRDSSVAEIREAMTKAARKENQELYSAFAKEIPSEIEGLGFSFYEVPDGALAAIADQEVLGDYTQSVIGYANSFTRDAAKAADRALGASTVLGEGIPQITNRLLGVVDDSRHAMSMFARTAIQTAGSRARDEFLKANSDLVKKKKYIATFDLRICPICAGYNGKIYALDKGPIIPVHVGCRCDYTPITKSWRELGIDADEVPPGVKASMDGAIPVTTDLESWLKKKVHEPKHADKLAKQWGRGRVELFKQGEVNLDDLAIRRRGAERVRRMGPLRQRAARRSA